jgi:hypothetical protein
MCTTLLVYVWLLLVIATLDDLFVYSKRLLMFLGPLVVDPHRLRVTITSYCAENILLTYPKDYSP